MFSSIRDDEGKFIAIHLGVSNIDDMLSKLATKSVDKSSLINSISITHGDIITFVNDLAIKSIIPKRYMIPDSIVSEVDVKKTLFDQTFYNDGVMYITDDYIPVIMPVKPQTSCKTKVLTDYMAQSYQKVGSKVLNPNSALNIKDPGLYGIISKHLPEFINFITWSKMNDIMRSIRSSADFDVNMSASLAIVKKNDSSVMDLVYVLEQSKDIDFVISDKKGTASISLKLPTDSKDIFKSPQSTTYIQDTTANIEAFRKGTVETLRKSIKATEERAKKIAAFGMQEGIAFSRDCLSKGWEIKKVGDRDCFVYPKKVFVTHVVKQDDNGKLVNFALPENCQDKLYVYDLTVPIDTTMKGMTMGGVTARGLHPHRSTTGRGWYDSIFNKKSLDALSNVCIGDMQGKPITELNKLIETFGGVYYNSMLAGGIERELMYTLFGRSSLKDYINSGHLDTSSTTSEHFDKVKEYVSPFLEISGDLNHSKKKDTHKGSTIFSRKR